LLTILVAISINFSIFPPMYQLYSINPFRKSLIQLVEAAATEDPDRIQFIDIESGYWLFCSLNIRLKLRFLKYMFAYLLYNR